MSFFREIGRILSQESNREDNDTTSNLTFRPLSTAMELEEAFTASMEKPVILFKHSATCPVSAMARRRIKQLQEAGDPPVYEVVVQSARSLSQKLAQDLGIRHESPQVILLHKQSPVYDTSHHLINVEDIRDAAAHALQAE
ncbi:MAG: bacillithiol system redox-active protein YtxJ [Bacteroidota bacterium]